MFGNPGASDIPPNEAWVLTQKRFPPKNVVHEDYVGVAALPGQRRRPGGAEGTDDRNENRGQKLRPGRHIFS